MEWSKPRTLPDGTKTESHPVFKIPLHLPDGRQIVTRVHVTENTGGILEQVCKSGELLVPEGEFVLTSDDLERRRFYFGIVHRDYNGQRVADVKFHSPAYSVQVNPSLEHVSFLNEAERGTILKSAGSPNPQTEPPPEVSGVAQAPQPPVQPPVAGASKTSIEELESLSPEEVRSALDYARKLRKKGLTPGAVVLRDPCSVAAEEWSVRMAAVRARLRLNLGLPPLDNDDDDL